MCLFAYKHRSKRKHVITSGKAAGLQPSFSYTPTPTPPPFAGPAWLLGGNSTGNSSYPALEQLSTLIICEAYYVSSFNKSMRQKVWRMNALLLAGAILAGVIVGIGVFGQRYRHHRFTRFIFLGANTLFLPVVSTVVSMGTGSNDYINVDRPGSGNIVLVAKCYQGGHYVMVVIWASLVQAIMINTSAIVAADDREGRNMGPPFVLLVQVFWTIYLGVSFLIGLGLSMDDIFSRIVVASEVMTFALTCAKMVFKYYAFEKARQSFALGQNLHLIFAYMQQPPLQGTSHRREPEVTDDAPPALLVMGEDKRHMDKQPHGYVFKDVSGTTLREKNGLMTIDRVWNLDNLFRMSTLKDLCLSFALFKLLRCRFARYDVTNASSNDNVTFFWSLLLKDGGHDRAFQVILDEISFVHDYYYSSIPISYSKCWLPIVGIFISLLSIAACCFLASEWLIVIFYGYGSIPQIWCEIRCIKNLVLQSKTSFKDYGFSYFDLVAIFLLLVLVVITEVSDMASYVCSNWTKVALVCRLLDRASSQSYICMQKSAGLLLRYRCKLIRHWDGKMGQCSVLVLHPRTTPPVLLWRLLHLPDQKRKVKVSAAVKVCIMEVLRSSRNGHLSNGTASLRRRGQVGERFLWACSNKSTSYTILTWHIATRILEARYPHLQDQEQGSSSSPIPTTNYKIAATHLSRYCAYLVTWSPELLPDDDGWSRSLYEDVKKDAEHVLAGCTAGDSLTSEAQCQQLIQVLSADANHEVLQEGARLGKQLVELMAEGEDTAWKLVAEFWSEMILYVAPSDNLKRHSEAMGRGGELITMLWVLLFHAGIVSRPGEDDGAAATSAGVV